MVLVGLICVTLIFAMVSRTQMPDTKSLENPEYEYASIIYTRDFEELGRYFKYNREWYDFENINPHLVNALIATEDERFYKHSGIDFRGTIRAIVYMGSKGGASTITQQLAKLFFTQRSSSFVKRVWQKLKEWVIAVEFEKRYTKQEILSMYLNKFDFLYNSYGIGAAAQTYFGKNQKDLTIDESAVLVGMLKNPGLYNPQKFPDNARKRRNVVLNQMVRNKLLKREAYDTLKIMAVDISNFKRTTHTDGPAPYFRSSLTKYLKALLDDDQYKKPDGSKYNIYQDGLKVYTTIDLGMQNHAESAMKAHMKQLQSKYFKVWENRDPWTYDATEYQLNLRKDKLNRAVRDSERFRDLRSNYMADISQQIEDKIKGARLRDIDILRMKSQKKNTDYFREARVKGTISKSQEQLYKKIMADPLFNSLLSQWNKLNDKAKSAFNQPVQMKIFAYNFESELDTLMTPMDSVKYHQMHMQLGSMSIEPSTGEVRTWVGGIGHKYFKFDHVKSDRQVGSTFKPFLYTTAIFQQGMSPCQKVADIQYTIPKGDPDFGLLESWSPANANKKFSGEKMTLMEGMKKSKNSVSLWLMKELGNAKRVIDLASNMGIERSKIPDAPSICLGTPDLNVFEMTNAYSCFANTGNYISPVFVTKIESNEGKVIYSAIPETRKVLPEEYNYTMVEMLKHASSSQASRLNGVFGGKTGTTNDYVDGWFMGITPSLVTGTWVGGEDPWIRFLSLMNGQGGVMARPFFLRFMQKLEADPKYALLFQNEFPVPEGEIPVLDCSKYDQLTQLQIEKMEKDSTLMDSLEIKKLEKAIEDEFDEEFDEGN